MTPIIMTFRCKWPNRACCRRSVRIAAPSSWPTAPAAATRSRMARAAPPVTSQYCWTNSLCSKIQDESVIGDADIQLLVRAGDFLKADGLVEDAFQPRIVIDRFVVE